MLGIAATSVFLASTAAANVLVNAGFEDPDLSSGAADINCDGGNCPGWSSYQAWGGPFIVDERTDATTPGGLPAHSGDQKLKAFGPNSGVFQEFAVNPGDILFGSAWAGSTDGIGDDMTGVAGISIEFFSGGANLGLTAFGSVLDCTTGCDAGWVQLFVDAIAPDGADTARFVLNANTTAGAAFFDDALFEITPVPVPAAVWLFGSALLGLIGVRRRRQ